ncbi:MAG: hypothetical protein Q9176_002017 [Flavoplaca citrina]
MLQSWAVPATPVAGNANQELGMILGSGPRIPGRLGTRPQNNLLWPESRSGDFHVSFSHYKDLVNYDDGIAVIQKALDDIDGWMKVTKKGGWIPVEHEHFSYLVQYRSSISDSDHGIYSLSLTMRKLLLLIPLALSTNADPDLSPRQAQLSFNGSTLTSSSALSSAAAQLITANIPTSIIPALAIAIQSAAASASVTGNINSLVSSVLTAATPAPFLEDLPASYRSRLDALNSQVGRIREEASEATVKPTLTRNATVVLIVTTMGEVATNSYQAEIVNGTVTSIIGALNETRVGSMASATGEGSDAGDTAAEPTSATEEGMAVVMKVPLVMGMLALVGIAVLL